MTRIDSYWNLERNQKSQHNRYHKSFVQIHLVLEETSLEAAKENPVDVEFDFPFGR